MSSFGSATEAGEGYVNRLYTGVENFVVTHVCPTHDELKEMFSEKAKADDYTLVSQEGGHQQAKIVIYLDNQAEGDEPSIKTRITYFVTKSPKLTTDGVKTQHINVYGRTAWLTPEMEVAPSGDYEMTGAKGTYVFESKGVRTAFQGEEMLIDFLRNLLNLPSLKNASKPEDSESQFSEADWDIMFNGNFAALRTAALSSPNKIGLLLGVKTMDDGKVYQDVYNRGSLRQWAKAGGKFDYLRGNVVSAQQNGSYPRTSFGSPDFQLREYAPGAAPSNESLFTQPAGADNGSASFFDEAAK